MFGIKTRRHAFQNTIEAMKQYERAASSAAVGDIRDAERTLSRNIRHWKEINFLLPAADLADEVGRPHLAALLYERHGDRETRVFTGFEGKWQAYEKAVDAYAQTSDYKSAARVTKKLSERETTHPEIGRTEGVLPHLIHVIMRP